MELDVLVLALASAPRPAGIAALYALISAQKPRRVLLAYVISGFAFSVAIGVLVVGIFHGADVDYRDSGVYSAIELLGGLAALAYAVAVGTGRRQPPAHDEEGGGQSSAVIDRLRNASVATALVAGVATHVPGLFYVLALNAIVADGDSLADGVAQVLAFNAIWFGAAIFTVVFLFLRPGATRRALGRLNGWARGHARAITVFVSAAAGLYLVIRGLTGLVG
jgi:Sap, sulfolipid-1-addressing protein